MKNIDELLGVAKLSELMSNDKKDESKKVLWVLAIIGAVAAVAGIAALVYKYLSPDYLEDIDDDYDDEEDDDEEEDDYEPEPRCRPVREQAERRTSSAPAKRRWTIILEDIVLFFMIRWESEGSVHRQSMTSFCPCRKI